MTSTAIPSPAPVTLDDLTRRRQRTVLKACIFATGLAGIVAEYVMATLASYLLGDAVLQWTLIVSLMLFAMGVGSRLSRLIRRDLLDAFVIAELVLSLLVAVSAPLAFLFAAWLEGVALLIYTLAFAIGLMIGLELPLATRLNESFEELRVNISSIFEKDYYGALLGGLLFAFLALPHLGLTYTPIVLGTVNFLVAAVFFLSFRQTFRYRRGLKVACLTVPVLLGGVAAAAEPIVLFGEQQKYRDRVVYQEQSRYQRIVITRWRDHHWLYLDGNEQFSSFDEERYHEPLVHPALALHPAPRRVLILGGGDGLAAREVLKVTAVETVTLVDLDPAMTELGRRHPVLTALNRGALDDPRLRLINHDALAYLEESTEYFDVVLIDLPDPKTVSLARLYSRPFYQLVWHHLSPGGVMVTQATSPFFSRRAFLSILRTVRAAGFVAVPYHNHIPTLGEWGWVLGVRPPAVAVEAGLDASRLVSALGALTFPAVETRFLNRESMVGMLSFGKGMLDDVEEVAVNEWTDLALFNLYREGDWDLY